MWVPIHTRLPTHRENKVQAYKYVQPSIKSTVVLYYKTKVKWGRFITCMDMHGNTIIKHSNSLRKSNRTFANSIIKGFRSYFKGVLGAPCASCGIFLKSLTTQKVFATHNVAPESLPWNRTGITLTVTIIKSLS